jgi:hypothetical protein
MLQTFGFYKDTDFLEQYTHFSYICWRNAPWPGDFCRFFWKASSECPNICHTLPQIHTFITSVIDFSNKYSVVTFSKLTLYAVSECGIGHWLWFKVSEKGMGRAELIIWLQCTHQCICNHCLILYSRGETSFQGAKNIVVLYKTCLIKLPPTKPLGQDSWKFKVTNIFARKLK